MLENYNSSQTDVAARLLPTPAGNYREQIQIGGNAKALPCIVDFETAYLDNYAWQGYIIPLDDYVSDALRTDLLPTIIEQATYHDKLYGLSPFEGGLALWGNRAYLEQVGARIPTLDTPWTLAEFRAVLDALQQLPEIDHALDMRMNYPPHEWYVYGFAPLVQSFGGDLIDHETYQSASGVLDSAESIAALQMLQDLSQAGIIAPPSDTETIFVEQRAALSWVGHWEYGFYEEALRDDLLLLPPPDFGHGAMTSISSWAWGISSTCEHRDLAWEIVSYLMQAENIETITDVNWAIPARWSVIAASELYAEGRDLQLYLEQIEAGIYRSRPRTPAYPFVAKTFEQVIVDVAAGADVEMTLHQAAAAIDEHLARTDYAQ